MAPKIDGGWAIKQSTFPRNAPEISIRNFASKQRLLTEDLKGVRL